MKENGDQINGNCDNDLSPEIRELLIEEAAEAEIEAAIDAVFEEEGVIISREEAIELLRRKTKEENQSPSPNE